MRAGKKRRCPEPCLPYVATSEEHFTGLRQMASEKKGRDGGQDAGASSDHVASWGGSPHTGNGNVHAPWTISIQLLKCLFASKMTNLPLFSSSLAYMCKQSHTDTHVYTYHGFCFSSASFASLPLVAMATHPSSNAEVAYLLFLPSPYLDDQDWSDLTHSEGSASLTQKAVGRFPKGGNKGDTIREPPL